MDSTGQASTTISVCMMVRNEEENLKRCLPSLQGLYDELIVVDTSVDSDVKDNTVSLAESYGAKVYHHPWENDFSKHRNQSMGYATSDWIFIVDADEEVVCAGSVTPAHLRAWLVKAEQDGQQSAAVTLRDTQKGMEVMRFHSVRFFKRGSVVYERPIHNQPKVLVGSSEAAFCPLLTIKHYGYDLSPQKAAEKRARTEGMLLDALRANPDDIASYFYLVQAYTAYGEYKKAAEYIRAYEECASRTMVEFNDSIYCTAASVYRKLHDEERMKYWVVAGLKKFPRDLDLLLAAVEFGVWTKNLSMVLNAAEGFLEVYDEYQKQPILSGNRFTYANRAEALAYCLFHYTFGLLQKSSAALAQLKGVLAQIGGDFEAGMSQDILVVLAKYGWARKGWDESTSTTDRPKKVVKLGRR